MAPKLGQKLNQPSKRSIGVCFPAHPLLTPSRKSILNLGPICGTIVAQIKV
jgi:hypothetical protein